MFFFLNDFLSDLTDLFHFCSNKRFETIFIQRGKQFSSKEVSKFPELLGTWTPSNSKTTEIGGLCAVPKLVDIGLMDREAKIGIFLVSNGILARWIEKPIGGYGLCGFS